MSRQRSFCYVGVALNGWIFMGGDTRKSYSMAFFCQKILNKIPGNWTFVVVTDRIELDKQKRVRQYSKNLNNK